MANNADGTVSVIDTVNNNITATVKVGLMPEDVVVNLAGTKVYVVHPYSDAVYVIDTATNTVNAKVKISSPHIIAVNPQGTEVYVRSQFNNIASVIDAATNNVTATVNIVILGVL